MKKIILVTHGEAEPKPDGLLTQKGRKQMEELKSKISLNKIGYVISGKAPRHREACSIVAGGSDMISEIVGVADTLSSNGKYMILADGERIPIEIYVETRYMVIKERVLPFLKKLFNQSEEKILIVGGRIAAIGAGIDPEEAKSAHIYYITQTPSGKIKISG